MRRKDHHTHNRARDLRGRLTSRAARRDEEYYDTDNFDSDNDFSLDDYYSDSYEREYMGGYHPRPDESNYGPLPIPRSGYEADFEIYESGDRSDYDLNDGLDIDIEIERHRRYNKVIPRYRAESAPSAPRRRRRRISKH